MDYTSMTIEELEARNQAFMKQIEDLRTEHDACAEALDKKIREKLLVDKFGGLSADEIAMLKDLADKAPAAPAEPAPQAMGAEGVESAEEVSVPN